MEAKQRVIALGFFDGVHAGHGALLRRAAEEAARRGCVAAAVTFDHHPKDLIPGAQKVPLISTPEDRSWMMHRFFDIEDVILLPFDERMRNLHWEAFVTELLVKEYGAVHLVAGHDFHFGRGGEGNPQRLRELCARLGIGCDIIEKVELDGITVSSTHIRGLLERGEMEQAVRFLGHPYVISGEVVHGKKLGRTIGIPTANLPVPEGLVTPAYGVYASKVVTDRGEFLAVTNVGVRPTVEDSERVTVEPWILDFSGDLYGTTVRVELFKYLRGEKKFPNLDSLRAAIHENARETRELLGKTGE